MQSLCNNLIGQSKIRNTAHVKKIDGDMPYMYSSNLSMMGRMWHKVNI